MIHFVLIGATLLMYHPEWAVQPWLPRYELRTRPRPTSSWRTVISVILLP